MKILVIIPAYNEEKSISDVIHKIKHYQPEVDIVVINDGSKDRTSFVARETGKAHVIDMLVNVGIGGAMQTGYLYAERNGYDIAIQIDGDGQHDPKELDKIVEVIKSGEADCCIGSRFLEKTAYKSSPYRRMGMVIFTGMIYTMVKKKITDPTSGFRAVNRKVIQEFARYYPDDYPEVEAIVFLERSGYKVKESSVLMHSRAAGKSSITPIKSMYYMLKVSLAVVMTRLRNVSQ